MIIKPGETYLVKFKFGNLQEAKPLHIQQITRRCYMQGGSLVGNDFEITTPDHLSYLIPERNVAMYQSVDKFSPLLEMLVLEDSDCGLFRFVSGGNRCQHAWANTGMSWTYCTHCDKEGWTTMGVTSER